MAITQGLTLAMGSLKVVGCIQPSLWPFFSAQSGLSQGKSLDVCT